MKVAVYSPQESGGETIKTYNQFRSDQQLKVSSRQVGENVVEKEEKSVKNNCSTHKDIQGVSTKVCICISA